ncbi:hypothetical protein BGZ60DRAFT_564109 [Tricladium varicosporioides]|nr:hypothetical protein BGZ60DRAFT_564109 [Hymenoscyphus varicosporioides]
MSDNTGQPPSYDAATDPALQPILNCYQSDQDSQDWERRHPRSDLPIEQQIMWFSPQTLSALSSAIEKGKAPALVPAVVSPEVPIIEETGDDVPIPDAPPVKELKVDAVESLKLKLPETFDSTRENLRTFLLQLRVYTRFNDKKFEDPEDKEDDRVLWAVSYLRGAILR